MEVREQGVCRGSEVFFHTPSQMARQVFLTLTCTGHYRCDGHYRVHRMGYESGLLLQVIRGEGYAKTGDTVLPLTEGDLMLLNSYMPHEYGTETGWEILWLHFAGHSAEAMLHFAGAGARKRRASDFGDAMQNIYAMFSVPGAHPDDCRLHTQITSLVTPFLSGDDTGNDMERIAGMLSGNLSEDIRTADLARAVHLSESQLNRLFLRQMGQSPHQYRMEARFACARYLLLTTDLTNQKIAEQCGFHDASTFVRAFRTRFGVTPARFRTKPVDTGEKREEESNETWIWTDAVAAQGADD